MTRDVNVTRWAILRKLMIMQQDLDTLQTAQAHRVLTEAIRHIKSDRWLEDLSWAEATVLHKES